MSNLIDLADVRRRRRKHKVVFDRVELRTLLQVYSKRVATGEWRDYAVDQHGPVAVFSMFRSSFETPVFAVAKRREAKGFEYLVLSGRRILSKSRSLSDALAFFDSPKRLRPLTS
ncbi:MAG: DUF2794 domain-containing protein [Alphaproteobacteria bacterium]|nr:DUF2794 domain-containing protein [Alphaproteobacteria bacterium]